MTETPDPEERIIGTVEAASRLGVSVRTVQRRVREAVHTGQIPVIHPLGTGRGKEYLIRESDLGILD